MTWRAILEAGLGPAPATHNAHNAHNPPPRRHSEDCEDYEERESKLLAALSQITAGLALSPAEVLAALSPDDVADWQAGLLPMAALATFARCLLAAQQRERGERPESYTVASTCRHCGPVWTWPRPELPAELPGCLWCHNRRHGRPIPRPALVRCDDCRHYQRNPDHPHLGRCEQGERGAAAGHWNSDLKPCRYWLPTEAVS